MHMDMSHMRCGIQFLYLSLASEAATVGVVQNPDPVEVGDNVALTCSATAVRQIKKLEWIDTATDRVLRREDEGVVDLQRPDLTPLNVSSVLTLSTNIKNGEKWPKNVTCKVELPKKGKVNGRSETYEATYNLVVTGKVESLERSLLNVQCTCM